MNDTNNSAELLMIWLLIIVLMFGQSCQDSRLKELEMKVDVIEKGG